MRPQKQKVSINKSKNFPESQNMYRLKLGKIKTEFYSERGNNTLKKIWIDNNLDEEMIFSTWIGPSEVSIRHKVSDYLQTFLLHRSKFSSFRDRDLFPLLRLSFDYDPVLNSEHGKQGKYEYFDSSFTTALYDRCKGREETERLRVEQAISRNDLPILPGYEYVSKHPIFRTQQLEKRMKYLAKIPIPYNQETFEEHILPIMIDEAISEEKINISLKRCVTQTVSAPMRISKLNTSELTDDSGITSDGSLPSQDLRCATNSATDTESEVMQVLSGPELGSKESGNNTLDNTIHDVCEVCGGLSNCDYNDPLTCSCITDPIWDGRESQCASSLFEEAAKIVDLHAMKRILCNNYMKKINIKTWMLN